MTPELWARVAEVFAGARELPTERRDAFLAGRCPDPDVRAEVERLLEADDQAGREDFLRPLGDVSRDGDRGDPRREARRGLHVRCPHCHGPIEILEAAASLDATCPSCGSTFRVHPGSTDEWDHGPSRRSFGRFEIVHWLGDGAFGTVYKARDPRLDRLVALKIPRLGNLSTPSDRERFFREARTAAQLRHPGIVRVLEVDVAEGLPYIATELVEGVTLADRLSSPALRPDFAASARLIAVLAEALDYAHREGVIHRDVKPSNVLLDGQGQALIVDFGLAKRTAGEVTIAADGRPLGTPAYMSPEQARGDAGAADGRTDVYGLGAVLYELLTGEPPFRGTARMILHQVLNDDPRPPRGLNDRVPRDLETICLKAVAKEPSRRYATAGDLAADLRRHLAGQTVLARPTGRVEKSWRWCRRNPRLAAASGLAAAALVAVGVVGLAYGAAQTRNAAEQKRNAVTERGLRDQAETSSRVARRERANAFLQRGLASQSPEAIPTGALVLARCLGIAPEDTEFLALVNSNLASWAGMTHRLRAIASEDPADDGRAERGEDAVDSLAVRPDGEVVLSIQSDRRVRFWDARTGALLRRWPTGEDVHGAAFGPDGATVATLHHLPKGKEGPLVAIRDATTGERRRVIIGVGQEDRLLGPAFGPEGRWIAAATGDVVRRWDPTNGQPLGKPLRHPGLSAMAVSRDGSRIATGGEDGSVRLWDTATDEEVPLGGSHGADVAIRSLAFTGDGVCLGSGDDYGRVYVWSGSSLKYIGSAFFQGKLLEIAASPVTDFMVLRQESGRFGSSVCHAYVIDMHGGAFIGSELAHPDASVTALALSPDGATIFTGDDHGGIRVWDRAPHQGGKSAADSETDIDRLQFSPDGRLLLGSGSDWRTHLWDARDGRLLWKFRSADAPQNVGRGPMFRFLPDGRSFTAELDGKGGWGEWDLGSDPAGPRIAPDAPPSRRYEEAYKGVLKDFHPTDPRQLVTFDVDTLRVWNTDGRLLQTIPVPQDPFPWTVKALEHDGTGPVRWSRDGHYIAVMRATLKIIDVAGGRLAGPSIALKGWPVAMEFRPDGKSIAVVDSDLGFGAWDIATGRPIVVHGMDRGQLAAVSPDGRTVACAYRNREVRFWDVATGMPARLPINTFPKEKHGVAFSPDRRTVAVTMGVGVLLAPDYPPLKGDQARIERWVEVITGLELDPDTGMTRPLDRAAWHARRADLDRLGGPPE